MKANLLGHTPAPRIGHELAQRSACSEGEVDQTPNCASALEEVSRSLLAAAKDCAHSWMTLVVRAREGEAFV